MKHTYTLPVVLALVACGPSVDADDDTTSTASGATSPTTTAADPTTDPTAEASSDPTEQPTGPGPMTTIDPADTSTAGSDDTGPIVGCDQFAQDCPPGQKCMPYSSDGGNNWNATICTPVARDPQPPGAPCTVVDGPLSGIDDCELGAMCWDVDEQTGVGECVAFCQGDESEPTCEEACSFCTIAGDSVLILCLPTCDPIAQDCPQGDACYPVNDTFSCAPDLSGDMGAIGDACEFLNVCDPGNFCANPDSVPGCEGVGCCAPFCSLEVADTCEDALPGTTCLPWYVDGQGPPGCVEAGMIGVCLVAP